VSGVGCQVSVVMSRHLTPDTSLRLED